MEIHIDELEEKAATSKMTPQRVDLLITLAEHYLYRDATQAQLYASDAKKLLLGSDLYALLKSSEKVGLKQPVKTAKSRLARCYLLLAQCSLTNNSFEEALEQYRAALELYSELGDKRGMAESSLKAGNVHVRAERFEEALRLYNEAVQLYFGIGDNDELSSVLINTGIVYFEISDYSEALRHVLQGLELAESSPAQRFYSNGLNSAGNIYLHLGDYAKALEYFLKALQVYSRSDIPKGKDAVHNNIATTYISLRDYGKALEHLQQSISYAGQNRNMHMLRTALMNTGSVHIKLGEFEKAHEYYMRAYHIAVELGNIHSQAGILLNLGIVFFEQEEYDSAIEYFARSRALETQIMLVRAETELYHGRALLRKGERGQAGEKLHEALDMAEKIGEKPLILECFRSLADYHEICGDPGDAIACLKRVQTLDREIFNEENQRRLHSLQVAHEVEQAKQRSEIFRLRADKLEMEKELQQRRLSSMTLQLLSKNEAFSTVKRMLAEANGCNEAARLKEIITSVSRLAAEQLHDNAYWQSFEESFDQLHPDFTRKIAEQGPELTPAELRICTLIRSNLSSKQIANMLCVTEKTIEVHRTNIRRKLRLDAKVNLQSYIAQL